MTAQTIGSCKEMYLVMIDKEMYKVGTRQGEAVSAQLVSPPPPRTTVRWFPAEQLVTRPTDKDMEAYDRAYGRTPIVRR